MIQHYVAFVKFVIPIRNIIDNIYAIYINVLSIFIMIVRIPWNALKLHAYFEKNYMM